MESRLLGVLGKVAGLGGIALGVLLLIFEGILQKQFLPQAGLNSAQAFAVILALMILTFGIAAIGILAWLISRSTNPKSPISATALGVLASLVVVVLGAAVYVGAQARAGGPENSITGAPNQNRDSSGGSELNQHSGGPLSPNIVGNNGSITIQGETGQKPSQTLIDAQCESKLLTTTPLAPGETIKVLGLWPTPIANGGGGLAEMSITKGTEFIWPTPKSEEAFPILNGYQCKITNYTDGPIFNLSIELHEEFRECIRDPEKPPTTMHQGEITLQRGFPMNIQKIDAGIGNSFIFYIYNTSDKVVILSIPDVMTVTMPNNTVQNVRLVHSGPMQFWPQLKLPVSKS